MLNLFPLTNPIIVIFASSATETPEDVGAELDAIIGIPTLAIFISISAGILPL